MSEKSSTICEGTNANGKPCKSKVKEGKLCHRHSNTGATKCKGTTKSDKPCSNKPAKGSEYCWLHGDKSESKSEHFTCGEYIEKRNRNCANTVKNDGDKCHVHNGKKSPKKKSKTEDSKFNERLKKENEILKDQLDEMMKIVADLSDYDGDSYDYDSLIDHAGTYT